MTKRCQKYLAGIAWIVLMLGSMLLPDTSEAEGTPVVTERKILSDNGSTRATAYGMSNKIVTANGKKFVVWLDHVSEIKARTFDIKTGAWGKTVHVGEGVDNHSGPALTMDSEGYLHIVYGTHHHPFHYRKSKKPYDIATWEDEEFFAKKGTYPSLICGPDNTLYCTLRSSATNPWRILLYSKKPGDRWRGPVPVVESGVNGYAWFGNSITIAEDNTIHLSFCLYDKEEPAAGKAAGYLRSHDGGITWENASGQTLKTPATPDSPCFVEQSKSIDLRAVSTVLDDLGRPWFSAPHFKRAPRSVLLWHLDGTTWRSVDLLPHLTKQMPGKELSDATIAFDSRGTLYAACTIEDILPRDVKYWGHPSQETILMYSDDKGESFGIVPLSLPDPDMPNWLPSIERPYSSQAIGRPSVIFMHGKPGEGLVDGVGTEVVFIGFGENTVKNLPPKVFRQKR